MTASETPNSTTSSSSDSTPASETSAPAPSISNAGTSPAVPRKLFVNIPVRDVQASIKFFEALDFTFNPQFTDASAAAMLVGTDAFCMLLETPRFAGFSKRPQGDSQKETNAIFALGLENRSDVDALVHKAIAAGGTHAAEPVDHGFMYGWSFYDLDGHHWEAFWMDLSAVPER